MIFILTFEHAQSVESEIWQYLIDIAYGIVRQVFVEKVVWAYVLAHMGVLPRPTVNVLGK